MPYLIDGHNLIAQVPGLSLGDPDDEAQLVIWLRRFAARKRLTITVIFDHGVPGGWSRGLSNSAVKVVFAGSHTNADRIIMERIRENRTPADLQVVSSDREIRQAAQARRATTIPSQEFAQTLLAALRGEPPKERDPREDVSLSKDEVKEWLRMFRGQTSGKSQGKTKKDK